MMVHQTFLARSFLFLLLTVPICCQTIMAQTDGTPWTGEKGIRETVASIMARETGTPAKAAARREEREIRVMPGRRQLPQHPDALAVSVWPPAPGKRSRSVETLSALSPQPVGVDYLATQISETAGYIPPDCGGAAGPSQIVVCNNGIIRTFNKFGAADGALNTSSDNFFSSVRNGSGTSDPHVVFDRISQRWFFVMINVATPNRVLIAVSSGPTISSTASFTFYQFTHDQVGTTPNSDTGGFADYPTLGIDKNAAYIGVNVFNAAGTAFIGATGFVVRKSSVTGGGPIVVTAFRQMGTNTVAGPYSPEGVTNPDTASAEGYFIGSDTREFGLLSIRRILNPGTTPSISSNLTVTVPATYFPSTVPAKGSTPLDLDGSDDRLSTTYMLNGHLWTSHAIAVDNTGVADVSGTGRDAVRFYELDHLTTTPALVQSGTLFSSASTNPRYFWNPSIVMSGQGHAAIGCSVAGLADYAGIAYSGRLSTDAAGTLQSATIFPASSAYNIQTDTLDGYQRWGDYSTTMVDPSDNMTIWTVQEYTNVTDSWGVRVTQLKAPVPATPSAASPPGANQGVSGLNVVVTGTSSSGSGFYDPGPSFPNRISASVSGGGVTVNSVTFTDPTHVTLNLTVAAGAAAGARTVTVTNPDGQSSTSVSGIFTVNNISCPTITLSPSSLPGGSSGSFYSQTISASGGSGPYTFAVTSGALPAGLGLSPAGLLSGTPAFGGSYSFDITGTDANLCSGTRSYLLSISGCPQITLSPASLPNGMSGVGYHQTISASGGTSPYTFAVSGGSLPAGLTLSASGSLGGTPSATGTYPFTVTATDSNLCTGPKAYSLTIDSNNVNSISLTSLGSAYAQNFNTLASSGTSSSLPKGWLFSESGSNANTTYAADSGGTNTGNTYSYGSTSSAERAFGCLQSGSLVPTIGASFTNNTGSTIIALVISYTGEQWRLGSTGRTDRLDFQMSTNATSLTSGTYADVNPLDFTSPVTAGSTGALNGNLAANRTAIADTVTGLSIPDGQTFLIRWNDLNATGADDGLSVDDFSLTPEGVLPTNPSGSGSASPAVVAAGDTVVLKVAVSPGQNPPSSGLAVNANLGPIGGAGTQSFYDDGTHGDSLAGDLVFSYRAPVADTVSPGAKLLAAIAGDAQLRTGNATIPLTVNCPAISLLPAVLPDGSTGAVYNQALSASGGAGPYVFAVVDSLPRNLSLSPAGVLSGMLLAGGDFSLTIRATDVHGCSGSLAYSLRVSSDSFAVVRIPVRAGWNMVSNPVTSGNDSLHRLFPTANSVAFSYDPGAGYQVSPLIGPRLGYWVRFPDTDTVELPGLRRSADTIGVAAGWNMVGSVTGPLSAAAVTSDVPGMATSHYFGYNSGYYTSDTIWPGSGYWVKASQTGNLIFSPAGQLGATSAVRIVPTAELPPSPPGVVPEKPAVFELAQNYPNPFNPATRFEFQIAQPAFVTLKVYDVLGREVATLVNETRLPGKYSVEWDATGEPSGVYYSRLRSGTFLETRKLVLIR